MSVCGGCFVYVIKFTVISGLVISYVAVTKPWKTHDLIFEVDKNMYFSYCGRKQEKQANE